MKKIEVVVKFLDIFFSCLVVAVYLFSFYMVLDYYFWKSKLKSVRITAPDMQIVDRYYENEVESINYLISHITYKE